MQASIQPIFTWSQNRIFAGAARDVILLVEWEGMVQGVETQKKSRKVVAREIELRVWLEAHVSLKACYGCVVEAGEGRSLLLKLGKIHAGGRKYIALEFTMAAMPAGNHEALWLQWQYKQPPVERIRELPLHKLSLEYTHHTDVLGTASCFHVAKHLELLKTAMVMEEAVALRSKTSDPASYDRLRRQADDLLLLATQSGDMQLVKEAEAVYKQLAVGIQVW
ncbi:hypothetical protein NST99_05190 [Paenibacillus sp. FSL L8-0470]|uniref:hypothetical protein n=1 Tax=Paenibacillus sp. FSL L8-0470 TaxID=2954688 RepID=UPI0030F894BC